MTSRNKFGDDFTENDVLNCLERRGLKYRNGQKYILSQCPTHEDEHPSTQIFKNDWFVNCLAGCGRFHITKAFPELVGDADKRPSVRRTPQKAPVSYQKYDLMPQWRQLPGIPADFNFKGIPVEILNGLGWRWCDHPLAGMGKGIFIPYFGPNKTGIHFAQMRHLEGDRRFTFLPGAKPLAYGLWNLEPGGALFIVEGASDCAVLEACAIPYIGMPSASATKLLVDMAVYCHQKKIQLIYAGDNDKAGNALRDALASATYFRTCQPPEKFKDWGDFFEAEGMEAVQDHCTDVLMMQHQENFGFEPGEAENTTLRLESL